MITVDGKKYKVVENLGFVHDRGYYAKVVSDNGKERVVIKVGRAWKFSEAMIVPKKLISGQKVKEVKNNGYIITEK